MRCSKSIFELYSRVGFGYIDLKSWQDSLEIVRICHRLRLARTTDRRRKYKNCFGFENKSLKIKDISSTPGFYFKKATDVTVSRVGYETHHFQPHLLPQVVRF